MLLRILRPTFQFGSLSTTVARKFYQTGTPVGDIIAWLATFALGGDYGGAAIYIAEHSPQGKRGLYTSWIQTTATPGLFISLGVILITRTDLGNDAFAAFGWCIPFLVLIFLIAIPLYIRISLRESPLFQWLEDTKTISKNPIRESFGNPYNFALGPLGAVRRDDGAGRSVVHRSVLRALLSVDGLQGIADRFGLDDRRRVADRHAALHLCRRPVKCAMHPARGWKET